MSSHGGGGSERWLVSYSDFITLLMVLFVVLYSMGTDRRQAYKALAGSIARSFYRRSQPNCGPRITQSGGTEDKLPPLLSYGHSQVSIDSAEVAGELTNMLSTSNLGGAVSVQNNIEGILISLSEKLTFKEGTAELQEEAFPILDTIIKMVSPIKNEIRVVGHTDNTPPPADSKYTSNWELSTARPWSWRVPDQCRYQPDRIIISGRGDTGLSSLTIQPSIVR